MPTADLATADACEARCCASHACTSWCWTPITRPSGCAHHGCCFMKTASAAETKAHTFNTRNFTSGCIGFACAEPSNPPAPAPGPHHPPAPAPPPQPPPPPLPFPFVTPVFAPFPTIFANNTIDALRDPTTAIFSAERGGSWHIYTSSMVCRGPPPHNCGGGYPGRIRHFSTPGTLEAGPAARSGMWKDEGLVLQPEYGSNAWDASGTFTPGVVKECAGAACKFYLFFGGVENQTSAHTESVGVAIAGSAWGPFRKYEHNPVFSLWGANTEWCRETSAPARVDEIKATQVGASGGRFLAVKAVCANFTALPVLFSPVNPDSWAPPCEHSNAPVVILLPI